LGLINNFVKALDVKGPAFTYLYEKFPRLTFEKVKAGVFIGPQIRKLFKDQQFEAVLTLSLLTYIYHAASNARNTVIYIYHANFGNAVSP
jgi:hypothetical protein